MDDDAIRVSASYRCDRCGAIWPMHAGCWCPTCGVVPSAHPWPGDRSTQRYFARMFPSGSQFPDA